MNRSLIDTALATIIGVVVMGSTIFSIVAHVPA